MPPPVDPPATDMPVIHADRVLIAPTLSKNLYCLDLHTGSPRWKAPRNNDHYLAAVNDETVLLVGNSRVRALRV